MSDERWPLSRLRGRGRGTIYGAPKTWVHNMGADRGRREKIGSKRRRDRVKIGSKRRRDRVKM